MRLPCPVGHYGLLSILGGSAGPPSLITLALLFADVTSCNIYTIGSGRPHFLPFHASPSPPPPCASATQLDPHVRVAASSARRTPPLSNTLHSPGLRTSHSLELVSHCLGFCFYTGALTAPLTGRLPTTCR